MLIRFIQRNQGHRDSASELEKLQVNPSPQMSEYLRVTVYPQYYSFYTLQNPWNMSQPSKIIATTNLDILSSQKQKHYLTIPTVLSKKQIYEIQKQSLIIPLQYADDIGYVFISKDNTAMQYQQSMLQQLLMKRNLTCNESKTEHTVLREMVTTHIKTVVTSAHSSIQQKVSNGEKY